MKKTDLKDLRNKDLKTLVKLASEKMVAAGKKRMEIVSGKEKNLKGYSNLRREAAKILTLIKEKQILEKMKGEQGTKS